MAQKTQNNKSFTKCLSMLPGNVTTHARSNHDRDSRRGFEFQDLVYSQTSPDSFTIVVIKSAKLYLKLWIS